MAPKRRSGVAQQPSHALVAFDSNPYTGKHLFQMLVAVFDLKRGEQGDDRFPDSPFHLKEGEKAKLLNVPKSPEWGSDGTAQTMTKEEKRAWDDFGSPLQIAFKAILLTVSNAMGWSPRSAYHCLLKHGEKGVYWDKDWPSWLTDTETASGSIPSNEASQEISSQVTLNEEQWNKQNSRNYPKEAKRIIIPDKIGFEVLLALFGVDALLDPASTPAREYRSLRTIFKRSHVRYWDVSAKQYIESHLYRPVLKGIDAEKKLKVDIHETLERLDPNPEDDSGQSLESDLNERDEGLAIKRSELRNVLSKLDSAANYHVVTRPHILINPDLTAYYTRAFDIAERIDQTLTAFARADPSALSALQNRQQNEIEGVGDRREWAARDVLAELDSDTAFEAKEGDRQIGVEHFFAMNETQGFRWAGFDNAWPLLNTNDLALTTNTQQVPLRMRPNQLTGALEIVNRGFLDTRQLRKREARGYHDGVILADETSLGKTLTAIMAITALAFYSSKPEIDSPLMFRADGETFADLLGAHDGNFDEAMDAFEETPIQRVNYATTGDILPPCLPSVIVAPANLIENWHTELLRTARKLTIHKITRDRGASSRLRKLRTIIEAWDQGDSLVCPAHHVLLLSLPMLTKFNSPKHKKFAPFDLNFLTMVVDEAHFAKTRGSQCFALNRLAKQAAFKIIQTATPVCNESIDVAYIGAAGDLLVSRDVLEKKQNMRPEWFTLAEKKIAEQDKMSREGKRDQQGDWFSVLGQQGTDQTRSFLASGLRSENFKSVLSNKIGAQLVDGYAQAISDVFALYSPYVIRRGKQSLDLSGQPLIKLGRKTEKIVEVSLSSQELAWIREKLESDDELREELGKPSLKNVLLYYGVAYKTASQAIIHPYWSLYGTTPSPGTPDDVCPTKINTAIEIMLGIMKDEASLVFSKRSKFVFHVDQLETIEVLLYELARRGLGARTFTGQTPAAKRRQLMVDVNKDDDHPVDHPDVSMVPTSRILICSPVAGVGINLHRTNVIFNLTVPWNEAAYRQRLGRHWRTPEDSRLEPLHVRVYTIFGKNTTYSLIWSSAVARGELEDRLWSRPDLARYPPLARRSKRLLRDYKDAARPFDRIFSPAQRFQLSCLGSATYLQHFIQSTTGLLGGKKDPSATEKADIMARQRTILLQAIRDGMRRTNTQGESTLAQAREIIGCRPGPSQSKSSKLDSFVVRLTSLYMIVKELDFEALYQAFEDHKAPPEEFNKVYDAALQLQRDHRHAVEFEDLDYTFSMPTPDLQSLQEWKDRVNAANGVVTVLGPDWVFNEYIARFTNGKLAEDPQPPEPRQKKQLTSKARARILPKQHRKARISNIGSMEAAEGDESDPDEWSENEMLLRGEDLGSQDSRYGERQVSEYGDDGEDSVITDTFGSFSTSDNSYPDNSLGEEAVMTGRPRRRKLPVLRVFPSPSQEVSEDEAEEVVIRKTRKIYNRVIQESQSQESEDSEGNEAKMQQSDADEGDDIVEPTSRYSTPPPTAIYDTLDRFSSPALHESLPLGDYLNRDEDLVDHQPARSEYQTLDAFNSRTEMTASQHSSRSPSPEVSQRKKQKTKMI